MRSLPLEDVAQRIGLQPDRYDKHKWLSEAHIISIKGQKFYDHLALKGGGGAIDLVMHVHGCDFKEAIAWLDGRSRYAIFEPTSSRTAPTQVSQKEPEKAPACNIKDESKWQEVKRYLTQNRSLPELLVESLYQQGLIGADSRRNAMFFRYSLGEDFSRGVTVYLSVDGAGAIPETSLRRVLEHGTQVILAHDADRAGEEMAWRIASALLNVTRLKPSVGKDWNEDLSSQKSKVKSQNENAMQQDFQAYRQTQDDLWQWLAAARILGKPESYLNRIAEVAIQFNASQPKPLSEKALAAMQQDLKAMQQQQLNSLHPQVLWRKYTSGVTATVDALRLKEIATQALRDGCSPDVVTQMLLEDPYFQKIQQQFGDKKAQQLARGAVQASQNTENRHQPPERNLDREL